MLSHHSSIVSALRRVSRVALLSLGLLTLALSAVAQAEPFAYITNQFSATVSVLDTATNTVVATVATGDSPTGVAVTPNGAVVYVANQTSNTVSVIATATNTVIATVPVGGLPFGVAVTPDGALVYVANLNDATVSVIATATNTVVATVPVGNFPVGVAVTPDGAFAYVTNGNSATVSVIATATNTVVATVPVGSAPQGVAVTPNGAFVYVANGNNTTVSVIATATNTVVATVTVGSDPIGVAVTPDGALVYVTNQGSANVSVIDTTSNTVVATVPVGNFPIGVGVTPDGAFVYVANAAKDNISVIATATNTVVATVPVGSGPAAFGQFIGPVVVCGNGIVGGSEQCDDGNTTNGDGCSRTCTIEPGYNCSGTPSTCQLLNRPPVAQCHNVIVSTDLNTCAVVSASINNGSSDPDGNPITLTQTPAGPYHLGATSVTLTVTDSHNATATCTGTVTVADGQAPAITCPGNQTATATSSSGAAVSFAPTASDNCGTVITSCSPPSGSTFPLGTTPVTCTATDGAANQNSCGFNVQVVLLAFTGISAKLEVERGRTPTTGSLEYAMTFTLGAGNNGIAPLTEPVTVQIGGLTFTIPAGSFRVDNKGKFTFEGKLSGVSVEASITPVSSGRYEFKLEAKPLNVSGLTNPVATQVRIGNDSGGATVTVKK